MTTTTRTLFFLSLSYYIIIFLVFDGSEAGKKRWLSCTGHVLSWESVGVSVSSGESINGIKRNNPPSSSPNGRDSTIGTRDALRLQQLYKKRRRSRHATTATTYDQIQHTYIWQISKAGTSEIGAILKMVKSSMTNHVFTAVGHRFRSVDAISDVHVGAYVINWYA